MSTLRVGSIIGLPDDPRKTEFVLSLLTKTREGKVSWTRKGDAYTAAIPNGVSVNFVLGLGIFGTESAWQLFTVRDRTGNELMQVRSPAVLSFEPSVATGPLLDATNQLFVAISGISGDELGQAIESLKKL